MIKCKNPSRCSSPGTPHARCLTPLICSSHHTSGHLQSPATTASPQRHSQVQVGPKQVWVGHNRAGSQPHLSNPRSFNLRRGISQTMATVVREEGLASLWRGLVPGEPPSMARWHTLDGVVGCQKPWLGFPSLHLAPSCSRAAWTTLQLTHFLHLSIFYVFDHCRASPAGTTGRLTDSDI